MAWETNGKCTERNGADGRFYTPFLGCFAYLIALHVCLLQILLGEYGYHIAQRLELFDRLRR